MLKIIFCDKNINNLEALENQFSDLPNITFTNADIVSVKADCIVSPGNSYGCMDGGVDRFINYSLNYISTTVKNMIKTKYNGEQPVGTTMLIKLEKNDLSSNNWKYLAHTPTMRIPKDISTSDNAYIAFRSLLRKINSHNLKNSDKINSVVVTSFCSGAGSMKPDTSAKQMRIAYNLEMSNNDPGWNIANTIESQLASTFHR